jgi:hypothetical protein
MLQNMTVGERSALAAQPRAAVSPRVGRAARVAAHFKKSFEEVPMSLSMYDVSAPVFRQILAALSGVLDKADAHCKTAGGDERALMAARLYDDMQPFSFQVAQSINHSAGVVAKLRGQDYPRAAELETFAACKAAVTEAIAYLDGVKPADLDAADTGEVAMETPRGAMRFTGRNYLLTFAYPNFFFHATTAYDSLRHNGVPVGKRDFMGAVQLKAAA